MLLLPFTGHAQLRPLEDQYMLNGLALNPAYAGSEELMSLTFSGRNQWVGFDGAPVNFTFGIHAPLRNDKLAAGLLVLTDKIGFYNETGVLGNYAYRLKLGNAKLALGLAAGVYFKYDNRGDISAITDDDIYLINDLKSHIVPEFSFGAYYYSAKYFLGISMPSFVQNVYVPEDGKYKISTSLSDINYMLYGGYRFGLSSNLDMQPSVLLKMYPGNDTQADFNASLIFSNALWFGASYRTNKDLLFLFQYQINRQLRIAYAYGTTFSEMSSYNSGTHEIMIKYNFDYLLNLVNPRDF